MLRHLFCAAMTLAASSTLFAQNPREPVELTGVGGLTFDGVIATEGDLTVVGFTASNAVLVRVSDGNGKDFAPAVRVDQANGALFRKDIDVGGVQISNGIIYVLWRDMRNGSDIYMAASDDRGQTFTNETVVFDFSSQFLNNTVRDWRLAVGGTGLLAFDTVAVVALNDPDSNSNEELVCRVSFDGGTTFLPQTVVPQGFAAGAQDVDGIDIEISDFTTINVAFSDDRAGGAAGFPDDVFLQQSFDGGQTWLATDRQLTTIAGANQGGDIDFDINGTNWAVTWQQTNAGADEIRLAVSTDNGVTFGDSLVATGTELEARNCGITDSGNVVVLYQDGPLFNGIATTTTTTDFGATFTTPTTYGIPSTVDTASFPSLAVQGNGACIAWSTAQSGGMSDRAFCAISGDAGLTWSSEINLSESITVDIDFVVASYNGLNDNAIVLFRSDPGTVTVSGVRPQTINAIGWTDIQNATQLGFELEGFTGDDAVFVVLSGSTGPTPVGTDGRTICLGPDFAGTFGVDIFSAVLTNGAGSTIVLPNVFQGGMPFGVTLNFAGIGFSSANGAGRLTDSQSFDL